MSRGEDKVKIPAKIKVIFIVALVIIVHILFDRRLREDTIWFLMKLALYIFVGAVALWVISVIAKEIFIKVVKIEDKEEKE